MIDDQKKKVFKREIVKTVPKANPTPIEHIAFDADRFAIDDKQLALNIPGITSEVNDVLGPIESHLPDIMHCIDKAVQLFTAFTTHTEDEENLGDLLDNRARSSMISAFYKKLANRWADRTESVEYPSKQAGAQMVVIEDKFVLRFNKMGTDGQILIGNDTDNIKAFNEQKPVERFDWYPPKPVNLRLGYILSESGNLAEVVVALAAPKYKNKWQIRIRPGDVHFPRY